MTPDPTVYRILAQLILETRPAELTCEDWLDRVGAYAECLLAGKPTPAEFAEVADHIRLCPECAEEFRALLEALREAD